MAIADEEGEFMGVAVIHRPYFLPWIGYFF